jgi:hypothetical protein
LRGARGWLAASLAAVALAASSIAGAQVRSPSLLPDLPAPGRFLALTEVSWYSAGAFVDSEGERQDFFESLGSLLATLRVSYSPARRFAFGVELPFRSTRLPVEGAAALTAQGVPGGGLFLDWSLLDSPSLRSVIRLEYFRSRGYEDRVVTISDGADRYSANAALQSRPGLFGENWRAAVHGDFRYASAAAGRDSFVESEVDLRAGPRVARLGGGDLRALALACYALSTEARQEGLVLHDLKARRATAGVALETEWPPAGAGPSRAIAFTAEHDFFARNSLAGWRLSLSLQSGF